MPSFKWDADLSKCWAMDLETQSAADLKAIGSRRYLRDPSTRIMSAAFISPHGDKFVWSPLTDMPLPLNVVKGKLPKMVEKAMRKGDVFAAHNAAGFDAWAWELLATWLPQPQWIDTMPLARASGLPGKLELIGKALGIGGKDAAGERAMKMLTKAVAKPGGVAYVVGTQALWTSMLEYNLRDVEIMVELFKECERGTREPAVLNADQKLNERGVCVDREMLLELWETWTEGEEDALRRVEILTDGQLIGADLRSHVKVKKWLESQGLRIESLERKSLEQLYDDPEEFMGDDSNGKASLVIEVLRLRQIAVRAGKGKLETALAATVEDERARNLFVYWGAHPGRWSGRGLQPHNMPRGLGKDKMDLGRALSQRPITAQSVRDCLKPDKLGKLPFLDDALATLVRPIFVAPLGKMLPVADYGAVEARCVAWLANEERLLATFRDPKKDTYCDMASMIYGREITKADEAERFVGKGVVLGCGYSMSPPKFDLTMRRVGVSLADAGVTAEQCVEAYRDAFPAIAGRKSGSRFRKGGLWRSLANAATNAVESPGTPFAAANGKVVFELRDKHLMMVLPSGRRMWYRLAKIEPVVPGYCKALGLPEIPKLTLTWQHPRGHRAQLYGGLLAENVSQATCRDLLADAFVRAEAACLFPVMHVHDELGCEADEDDVEAKTSELARLMSIGPNWSEGFPILVEAFSGKRYTKGPLPGAFKVTALNGRII